MIAFDHRTPSRSRRFGNSGVGWVAGTLIVLAGCGRPPQIAEANRSIVLALATATSAENPEWLERCAAEVAEAHARGTLTAAEDRAFNAILDHARSGRWEPARRAAYGLRDAQRPTAAMVEAVSKRTLPEPKTPPSQRR